MSSAAELRERLDGAMRRAERAGKTDPAKELHEALIAAFPAMPLGDLKVTAETDAIIKTDGKPEVITWVTFEATTSAAGAYYLSEILNQLSEENG